MAKKPVSADRLRSNDVVVVSAPGGELLELSSEGEVLAMLPVSSGRYSATRFLLACGRGNHLVPGERVTVFPASSRVAVSNYGALTWESSANPEFRLTDGERDTRNRKLALSQQRIMELRLAKQFRALERARGRADDEPVPPVTVPPVVDAPAA